MRKQKIFLNFMLCLFLVSIAGSCDQEERGALTTDDTIPSIVSKVSVTNLPGGAKIEYSVPADKDALLVEASYTRNGEQIATRSSVYKNFVLVEGLKETSPQEVSLVTVDRSDNRSEPVKVTINPEKAPIDRIFDSFELLPDFGGVRLKYTNENEIKAELLLFTIENGQRIYQQSAFVKDNQKTHFSYRGFPPETQEFGIIAVDRWDNSTELLSKAILPLEETVLDRLLHEGIVLTGDEPADFGWVLPNLFNGTFAGSGYHTAPGSGSIVSPYTAPHHIFSIDLGVLAKLSRFKFWPRQDGCCTTPYGHGDPRYFEIWGIDELPADNGASLEGWTRMIENGEVIKPSGAPVGTHSADDTSTAQAGWEFELPLDAPPVRYIRFVNFENWSNSSFIHIMEMEFYGQLE